MTATDIMTTAQKLKMIQHLDPTYRDWHFNFLATKDEQGRDGLWVRIGHDYNGDFYANFDDEFWTDDEIQTFIQNHAFTDFDVVEFGRHHAETRMQVYEMNPFSDVPERRDIHSDDPF